MELGRRNASGAGTPVPDTSMPTQNMDSILNRTAPAASIYQNSLVLLDKLACIPGFEPYLATVLDDNSNTIKDLASGAQYLDPIQLLWDAFRQGTSMCVLYNALRPAEPLKTTLDDGPNTLNQRKDRVYRFVKACKENKIVNGEDLFTISDLYKDDTNSFVKVLKTVGIVLDVIEARGFIDTGKLVKKPSSRFAEVQLGPPQDNRERVIKEFVETERRYVQDLETLQDYMQELQRQNVVPDEIIRYLFANLNSMIDFQRRFLIGVEANASLHIDEQHFGALFINMEEVFAVYEPYCANFSRATKLCVSEANGLSKLAHIIEPHYELPSMLIKPVQRICKYPIMMEELSKFYSKDSPIYKELREGISAINRVVEQVNEAERREGNLTIVSELEDRVEDWKGYSISTFGELFLHDTFVMSTTGVERELFIYLFENILICCKEMTERDKRKSNKTRSNGLQLKGRIFLHSIHSVVDTSRDSQLSLTIYWRDVVMENFSLACRSEEQLKLWKTTMERLILRNKERNQQTETPVSLTAAPSHKSSTGHQDNYDSEEDVGAARRGRYSEGSSLTAAMRHEKPSGSQSYRKTYDGAAMRPRNHSRSNTDGGYQKELAEGIERSLTISHSRQPTNGSSNDSFESSLRSRGVPVFPNASQPIPPLPPLSRHESDSPLMRGGGRNGMINSPMPTAFMSAMSPITPGTPAPGSQMTQFPGGSNGASSTPGAAAQINVNGTGAGSVGVQQTRPTKVKVHFQEDIFVIVVKSEILFKDLIDRVERKIKICAGPRVGVMGSQEQDLLTSPPLGVRMKYQDEDGDMILIGSDEDVQMAFESANASRSDQTVMSTLNLFVSL